MLLRRKILEQIRSGTVSLAFRRWKRPTVRAGGTLMTVVGELAIDAVDRIDLAEITDREAKAAGYANAESVRRELDRRTDGEVYRIRLAWAGEDPRRALRREVPTGAELEKLLERLRAIDDRSKTGPWTGRVLRSIARRPATLAAELAAELDLDRDDLKRKVRRLKTLGLTESLAVGYRLSPRGEAAVAADDSGEGDTR